MSENNSATLSHTLNYVYRAHVDSIYDGDTLTCSIDCGFGVVLRKQKIRLFGLNAAEVRGSERAAGIQVRDALRDKILDQDILLRTIKDRKGKYGRYLGIVYFNGENINDWLVENNYATPVSY